MTELITNGQILISTNSTTPSSEPVVVVNTSTPSIEATVSSTSTSTSSSSHPRRRKKPMGWARGDIHNSSNFMKSSPVISSAPSFIPPKDELPLKIGSLLWLEQVGQCIFMEYGDDIIIVDCGLEFAGGETLGADYIIPDISYLQANKHKIKWVVITHGHLDHIGWLRHVLPELDFPMMYTTPLALGLIKKSFDDQRMIPHIKYQIVNPDIDLIKLGCFTIEFVRVNHNIPETMALSIQTPKGIIFNSADFKIDHTPAIDRPADLGKIARIWLEWVKLYIGDSLWCDHKGRSQSEKGIWENLDGIIKNAEGRLLIAMFATNVGRIIQTIESAIRHNKVVFLTGRSMINNVDICEELGYIKVPKWYIRDLKLSGNDINNLPANRVVILSTGAQWEEFSALWRLSRGEHAQLQLVKGDTILISARAIPWNEKWMSDMINDLIVRDINLITNDDMDVHASGHGYEEDHKLMLWLLKPQFFLPYFMPAKERYAHRKIAMEMGMSEHDILMPVHTGAIIEVYNEWVRLSDHPLKLDTILIDGKWIGSVEGEFVMKARKTMSENGTLTFVLKVDTLTRALVGKTQIESRGFVYSGELQQVHNEVIKLIEKRYQERIGKVKDLRSLLKDIKSELELYLLKILDRVPMIIPMFVTVGDTLPVPTLSKKDESSDWTASVVDQQPTTQSDSPSLSSSIEPSSNEIPSSIDALSSVIG